MKKRNVCLEMSNDECFKAQKTLKKSAINYGQNSIIIAKRTKEEQIVFDRKYRTIFVVE